MTMTEPTMSQGEFLWTEHADYITNTARSIARSFIKVEEEDVTQEIWVFLWDKEYDLLERGASDRYIRTCIKNVARNYALKVRDSALLETDKFYYSFDEVRDLLPSFFNDYEAWNQTSVVHHGSEVYDSRDSLAMMCDFSLAFEKLNDSMRAVLLRKYGLGEELAEAKDRQQASRALKKFVLTLNADTDKKAKAHEGPGSRKSLTNSAGIYKAKESYYD